MGKTKDETALEVVPTLPSVNAERLIALALERSVPIDVMERLLAMRDRLKAEQAKAEFLAALSAFQGACPIIRKTKEATIRSSTGMSYTYLYAPLDVIVAQVSPLLAQNGLSHTVEAQFEESAVVAVCWLHHIGGHSQSSSVRIPVDKGARMNDAQKVASALTYAKRYAFCDALGILTGEDDDDGHGLDKPEESGKTYRRPKAVHTPTPAKGPHLEVNVGLAPPAAEEPGDDVADDAGIPLDEWPKERRQFKNMPLVTHAEFKKLMATLRERVGKNADEQLIAKLTECGIHHRDEIPHISLPRLMEWAKGEPERKAHAKIVRKR